MLALRIKLRIRILFRILKGWSQLPEVLTANTHFICEITTTKVEKIIKPNNILFPPDTDHESKFYFINCCGSGIFIPDAVRDIFPSRIPDPGSQIPQPNRLQPRSRIRTKEFKYSIKKKKKKKMPINKSRIDTVCILPEMKNKIYDTNITKMAEFSLKMYSSPFAVRKWTLRTLHFQIITTL